MFKKLTFALFLAATLQIQDGLAKEDRGQFVAANQKACTAAKIAEDIGREEVAACDCTAAEACAGAFTGGAVGAAIIKKLADLMGLGQSIPAIPLDSPKRAVLVGYLGCMAGAMSRCPNWKWNSGIDFRADGANKCGLQYCNVYALNAVRLLEKHGGSIIEAAKEAADTAKPIKGLD